SDLQYRVRRQRGQSEAEFIPLDKFGGKEAEGEAAIPVNELAPQDKYTLAGGHQDVTIDFTLEAIDTKGQSTSSRRVRVRVLRETYDRSLAELITHLGDLSDACQRGKRSFNSAVNSLIIFRDSLGEGSEWDETRKKKLKKIVSQIRPLEYRGHGARMRSVAYKFSTYPYRAQRAGDYLFSRAEYLNKDYSPLAELGKDADPNRKLGTAIELLKMQKRFLSDLQSAVNGTIEMLRTDRLNYLMKLLRRDLSRFNPDAGEEYVELFRGRQSARATSIAKAVKQLNLPDDSEIEDAIGKLETAAEKFDIEAISEASSKLQEAFREKSVFAGNRPKAFHNLRANWSDGVLIKQAKGEAEAGMRNDPLVPIKKVWGKEIQLAGDARLTDENRMAARALGLLQIETGEAQPQKLIESLDDDRPADAYLVLDHLNQAFQEGRALLEGVGSGRVNASSLAAERCWRRFRDVLLVLMDEVENGGVAVSENELEKEFERLLGFRPLVSRWDVAGVLEGPTERTRLVELVFRLDKARQLAFCLPELTGTDSETMLKEACGYLAEMFQNLRADAFQRMEFLKKKVQEEGEADVVLRDGEHKWPDYSKYGVEREKDILRYTGLYRKVLDLAEVQRILEGEFNPEWAGRYDAVTRYIWWLGNDVALSFGRYEGPSVVRRHARGAGAFLNKMETYPDNLEKAAVALEKLAGKDNAVDAVETLVKTARIELEMEEAAKRSRQYCDLLEKPADLKKAREDFARAYGEPIAGAYLAAQIAIPLRRLSRGLMDPNTSEEDWWKTLRANAREAKTLLQILEDRSRAAEDVLLELKLFTDAETERPDEDVCRESARVINGFLETLEPKIELPPVRVKLSKQMRRESRLNAREYHSRERTFRLWRLEISRQARYCERETVELLLRRALRHKIQGALKGLQAQFAHYRVAMRKSQGVERESGGQLDVKIAGVKFERLAMPKYLYEELLRANAKPYPKQFKEQGLDYIRGLLNDAKR
ncbi:MAG: hypothetical protein KGZ25_01250, partial [Planctomycetes bacterium]|nr:hypothetical protein [Planctomycetota bacterium]